MTNNASASELAPTSEGMTFRGNPIPGLSVAPTQTDERPVECFGRRFKIEDGLLRASAVGDTNNFQLGAAPPAGAYMAKVGHGEALEVKECLGVIVIRAEDGVYVLSERDNRGTVWEIRP